jgi:riboflavin kinase/FMN adenylyltransferase
MACISDTRRSFEAAQEHAAQHHGTAVVVTFDPHPAHVLRPGSAPKLLCGPRHQQLVLSQIGIPCLLTCPFTAETASTPARDFIQQLVHASRPLGCISVGYTWNFGHKREGNIHLLMELGPEHDFAVYGVPPLKNRRARSSAAPSFAKPVSVGNFTKAASFARPRLFRLRNRRRGKKARTSARLSHRQRSEVENEQLPPLGVYAVEARIDDTWLPAVANLGRQAYRR